ncbi:MAG: flavodoxin [Acidimicrobiia bacterium]|nr:flavodoxin domain-containing protein [Acidimicrobiia bacterium]NNC74402.1 flavodoxin [Acidimicrobiia bacterium]NNK91917.1 flavodoxin [Acidimicrobiia bacterium]
MRALVVYESMFGNTQAIAESIAKGLAESMDVEILEVSSAPSVIADIELLVVGGPTHQFGMSRPQSREAAFKETDKALVSESIGIREWIKAVRIDVPALACSTFDTKVEKPPLPGAASKKAEKKLRKKGVRIVLEAETFDVDGMTGPLIDGELERAHVWGETLASAAAVPTGA